MMCVLTSIHYRWEAEKPVHVLLALAVNETKLKVVKKPASIDFIKVKSLVIFIKKALFAPYALEQLLRTKKLLKSWSLSFTQYAQLYEINPYSGLISTLCR